MNNITTYEDAFIYGLRALRDYCEKRAIIEQANERYKAAMNAKQAAREVADSVLSSIPEFIEYAIEKRRKEAAWFLVYRRARLASCHPIWRPFWRLLVKKSQAAVAANKATAYLSVLGDV